MAETLCWGSAERIIVFVLPETGHGMEVLGSWIWEFVVGLWLARDELLGLLEVFISQWKAQYNGKRKWAAPKKTDMSCCRIWI